MLHILCAVYLFLNHVTIISKTASFGPKYSETKWGKMRMFRPETARMDVIPILAIKAIAFGILNSFSSIFITILN
jgi:hypothetical protein